ncbi:MAG TPA: glycosyltransferase [Terriglobales bacterium]
MMPQPDVDKGKKCVLVVGQTPPPYHGQAIMIRALLDGSYVGVRLVHQPMNFSHTMSDIGVFNWRKVAALFALILGIIYRRFKEGATALYYPPAGPNGIPIARDVVVLLATRWLFRTTILHFHAGGLGAFIGSLNPGVRRLCLAAYGKADIGIRMSDAAPDDPMALKARRSEIVPYGIADSFPHYDQVRSRRPRLAKTILFAGALRESKGILVLLDAFSILKAEKVRCHLVLMGEWESSAFERTCRDAMERLDISPDVSCVGLLSGDAKFEWFAKASVLCLPSHYSSEAFPVSIIEAMQFALPVVATRWRGIPDLVRDGVTGTLVEPRDPRGVATALANILSDEAVAAGMGAAARREFQAAYTIDAFHRRMDRVMTRVTSA